MRSQSKGWVRLSSSDYRDKPKIQFNYMSKDEDWEEFRAAVRLTREIFQQDEQLDAYLKGAVESAYHPSCTCKMGSDEMAVVDAECKVRGLNNLRIVDSSIMPSIVSGNLNAPTIMIAEKAADLIKGVDALPTSDAPVYLAENYQESQR